MDSDSLKFFGLVQSLTGELHVQLCPIIEEYMFCGFKIKQLRLKNSGSADVEQQIVALAAIQSEDERRVLELLRSVDTSSIFQSQ